MLQGQAVDRDKVGDLRARKLGSMSRIDHLRYSISSPIYLENTKTADEQIQRNTNHWAVDFTNNSEAHTKTKEGCKACCGRVTSNPSLPHLLSLFISLFPFSLCLPTSSPLSALTLSFISLPPLSPHLPSLSP